MTKKELEDELKTANNCIRILEEQSVDATKLLVQIADLEHDLKEQKFCYQLAASRAKHFKSQLAIIKETLSLKETQ
jgi:hypothetical protein